MQNAFRIAVLVAIVGTLFVVSGPGTRDAKAAVPTAGQLIISEFRVRGPSGANDEFIEIYNTTGADFTVTAASGTGLGIAASDGVTRCVIPTGTVIPAGGHWLCTNSVAYSLAGYSTGNATYTTDIPDNAGIALFNNDDGGASYSLANRLDAVGSTSEANTLYKEGTGYPALTPFSIDYSFARRWPGGCTGNNDCLPPAMITTPGPTSTHPVDTNNNASDFILFVDTNGTSAGAGQRLGAPGPQNLASPAVIDGPGDMDVLDTCTSIASIPNVIRDFTSDPANNSTFGTLDIRSTYTNNTGANITALRFRVIDITTFPSASGVADLRPRTSADVVVTVDRPPCGSGTSNVTVEGTTLDQPPSQPNGGGFNSTLSQSAVSGGTPLANGATIDSRFLLGIQQTGTSRFCVIPETIPPSTSAPYCYLYSTDPVPTTAGQLIISEFRLRGPNGANDEFIDVYNTTGLRIYAQGTVGSTGLAIAASDGVARCVIPNGTLFLPGGHYLCSNSVGYSLASYPSANATTATGNQTYTTDIPDNAGIAIFNNSLGGGSFSLANRIDAVGSTSEANTTYKEGAGYPALTPFSIDYSFVRKVPGGCTGSGNPPTGNCSSVPAIQTTPGPTGTQPVDTGDNAADFIFVDTNGTSAGSGQRLGAPGPQNSTAPGVLDGAANVALLDSCIGASLAPNVVRDFTSDPANNSTFGTLDIRVTYTNTSGGLIDRLRFRVLDITTFPSISGVADLRPRTSTAVVVTVDRPPCGSGTSNVTVQGTTLEQPPSQPNGGGYNSSLSVGTVTTATPIANGASVDLRFLLGIQQTGAARFCVAAETVPASATQVFCYIDGTDNSTNLKAAKVQVDPVPPTPVLEGNNIRYVLFAANQGPGVANAVTISDTLPAGTTFVSAVASRPAGGMCVTPPVGSGGVVSCTWATINANDYAAVTLTIKVTPGFFVPPGPTSVSNTSTATTTTPDTNPADNTSPAVVTPVNLTVAGLGGVLSTQGVSDPQLLSYQQQALTAANQGYTATVCVALNGFIARANALRQASLITAQQHTALVSYATGLKTQYGCA